MGFCIPFNLGFQEWIILIIFSFLIFIAVWNDRREGKWKKFKKEFREEKEINGKKIREAGIDKRIYYIQKGLDYLSGGLIIRQIFNPYILFPLSVILFWILKINSIKTGDLLLILTLVAVIWYSRETLVLRQEQWRSNKIAQKGNEINEKPILNFYVREWHLHLRNVGRGPAYNIHIEDIVSNNKFVYTPYFREPNFILESDGDEKEFSFQVTIPDGGTEIYYSRLEFQLFIDRLFPRDTDPSQYNNLKSGSAIFLINYEGLNNRSYHSIFRLYPRVWPLLNNYNLVVEYIKSGDGKCEIGEAKRVCTNKELPQNLSKT